MTWRRCVGQQVMHKVEQCARLRWVQIYCKIRLTSLSNQACFLTQIWISWQCGITNEWRFSPFQNCHLVYSFSNNFCNFFLRKYVLGKCFSKTTSQKHIFGENQFQIKVIGLICCRAIDFDFVTNPASPLSKFALFNELCLTSFFLIFYPLLGVFFK